MQKVKTVTLFSPPNLIFSESFAVAKLRKNLPEAKKETDIDFQSWSIDSQKMKSGEKENKSGQ